jgi:peroxiredoxin
MTTNSRFVKIGQPAPNFTLPAVDGRQVSLNDYQGDKHVVLVFLRGFM